MRAMTAPTENPQDVYKTCIESIADNDLRNRLTALNHVINKAAGTYQFKGKAKKLYTLPPNNCKNNDVFLGKVTKKELKDVYSTHMVGRTKPARNIYDKLLSQAPLGRCPFCGMGYASTLDHYLPKSQYPELSVMPLNLVPSCKDCNTGKSTAVASTEEAQILHPYFDHGIFISEQWLFAEVVSTSLETTRYFVKAPKDWDDISKNRVLTHFDSFKLADRYSIEAVNELASRKKFLNEFKKKNGCKALIDLLRGEFNSRFQIHKNSWQTALYQALANLYNKTPCPICLEENVICNETCPACHGIGQISKSDYEEIIDTYQYLNCICGKENNKGCSYCTGTGLMRLEEAQKINERRP